MPGIASPGIIPRRQISILAGASGSGKTTLILQAIQAWATQTPFPFSFDATSAAYVVADRTKEEVEYRANRLGLEIEIYGLPDDKEYKLSWLNDPGQGFVRAVGNLKRKFDLLVIDPFTLFLGCNTLNYTQVAQRLIWFNRFAIERDITLLATHHATKARSDFVFSRPQDRISGTSAFQGYSGTQMILIEGKESGKDFDRFYMIPHLYPPSEFSLQRNQDGWFELAEDPFLALIRGEVTTAQLLGFAEKMGMSRVALFNRLKAEVQQGRIKKLGYGLYGPREEYGT